MNAEYQKALKEGSATELFMAHQRLAMRRNLALVAGIIALVVILWLHWSVWLLAVPAVIWVAAAGQHTHLKLVQHELKERKSAASRDSH